MEWFSPQRRRPVRDPDGVAWPSVMRLVGSLFFEDRIGWAAASTTFLSSHLLDGAHVVDQDDVFVDGLLCRMAVSTAAMRARVPIESVKHHDVADSDFLRRALVAASVLQVTQHPRLQRLLLGVGRRFGCSALTQSDASVLKTVASICGSASRGECRQLAIVGLCALRDELETGVRGDCELFLRMKGRSRRRTKKRARAGPGATAGLGGSRRCSDETRSETRGLLAVGAA